MKTTTQMIRSDRLGEQYTKIEHASGLTILLYPMQGYSGAQVLFGTKYGSIDTRFRTGTQPDFFEIPAGTAHFLEHKLFEDEDGDAFAKYAKTGAAANAYTSFDRTVYLFSCTDNFDESLDILLKFVTKPYFTKETVEKEQGIIGQEIQMYEDNPEWRVYFNLLSAMYHNHPVRIDIAGTVESIAKIDADVLYRCYNTFYNLNNMVLCISGNFSPEAALSAADKILKPAESLVIDRSFPDEPDTVCQAYVEQRLPVALPLFHLGFKASPCSGADLLKNQIVDEILLDIVAGESTQLYRRLYDEGLIKGDFCGDTMAGQGYYLTMFMGESRDPERVRDEILAEIGRIKKSGIDPELFARSKKASYGNCIGMYGRVDSVGSLMLTSHIMESDAYTVLETAADVTMEDVEKRLHACFDETRCVLSVVRSPD